MSSAERLFTIGFGGPAKPIHVYLRWSRAEALTDYVLRSAGSLEAVDFTVPELRFAADTMPRFPRSHDKYFSEGGTHAPDRWIAEDGT